MPNSKLDELEEVLDNAKNIIAITNKERIRQIKTLCNNTLYLCLFGLYSVLSGLQLSPFFKRDIFGYVGLAYTIGSMCFLAYICLRNKKRLDDLFLEEI